MVELLVKNADAVAVCALLVWIILSGMIGSLTLSYKGRGAFIIFVCEAIKKIAKWGVIIFAIVALDDHFSIYEKIIRAISG